MVPLILGNPQIEARYSFKILSLLQDLENSNLDEGAVVTTKGHRDPPAAMKRAYKNLECRL